MDGEENKTLRICNEVKREIEDWCHNGNFDAEKNILLMSFISFASAILTLRPTQISNQLENSAKKLNALKRHMPKNKLIGY